MSTWQSLSEKDYVKQKVKRVLAETSGKLFDKQNYTEEEIAKLVVELTEPTAFISKFLPDDDYTLKCLDLYEYKKKTNELIQNVFDEQETLGHYFKDQSTTTTTTTQVHKPIKPLPMKLKLILGDISEDQKPSSFVTWILSWLNWLPEYGYTHAALLFGPHKIDWTMSELVIPQKHSSRMACVCIDLGEITSRKEYEEKRKKVAELCVNWNKFYSYDKLSTSGTEKGNCQMFINHLLAYIGVKKSFEEYPVVARYLDELQQKGEAPLLFEPCDEFCKAIGMEVKNKIFTSHKELDQFVIDVRDKLGGLEAFKKMFPGEFLLLKSFDRAFWLRHFNNPTSMLFMPLDNGKEEATVICPFQDPSLANSILK